MATGKLKPLRQTLHGEIRDFGGAVEPAPENLYGKRGPLFAAEVLLHVLLGGDLPGAVVHLAAGLEPGGRLLGSQVALALSEHLEARHELLHRRRAQKARVVEEVQLGRVVVACMATYESVSFGECDCTSGTENVRLVQKRRAKR